MRILVALLSLRLEDPWLTSMRKGCLIGKVMQSSFDTSASSQGVATEIQCDAYCYNPVCTGEWWWCLSWSSVECPKFQLWDVFYLLS